MNFSLKKQILLSGILAFLVAVSYSGQVMSESISRTIPAGGGTFYAVFKTDSNSYFTVAHPAGGCRFVKNPSAGSGWIAVQMSESVAKAKRYYSDPLKAPGFFGVAVRGRITTDGPKGTPPPWRVKGDRINIHCGDEYVEKISPWGKAVSFTTSGGKEIHWTLEGTNISHKGRFFRIKKKYFKGDNPLQPGTYTVKAVDLNGKKLAKIKFTSFLSYKPTPVACLIQHKDTNAVCEKCRLANVHNHDYDKEHPNDYNEISNCRHCQHYCTRAVVVSMGKAQFQDNVKLNNETMEKMHVKQGVNPTSLPAKYNLSSIYSDVLIKSDPYFYYSLSENIYKALKANKIILIASGYHSRLCWGIQVNNETGRIIFPKSIYSDPAKQGNYKMNLNQFNYFLK